MFHRIEKTKFKRCEYCGAKAPLDAPEPIDHTCAPGAGDLRKAPHGGCCDPPPTDADGRVLPESA